MIESGHLDSLGGLMMAHSNSSANGSDEVAKQVGKWLSEEGWTLVQETRPDFLFVTVADDGTGRKMVISQRADKADRLSIEASVSVSDQHKKRFEALPQKKRRDFLWDLRFELLHMDVEFGGLSEPVERIGVGQPVYHDALNKDEFFQRFSQVKRALLVVLWRIGQLMEEPPTPMGFIKG